MSKIITIIGFLLIHFGVEAQKRRPVEYILEVDNDHRHSGWFIGAGPTYMLSNPGDFTRSDTLSPGVSYAGKYDPKGKLGLHVEIGGFHIFDHGIIHFIDYGFNYRTFKAEEVYSGDLENVTDPAQQQTINGVGAVNQRFVGANFGVNRLMAFNRYFFALHNLNLNFNYRFSEKVAFDGLVNPSVMYESNSVFQGDLSYKFGMGFRMRTGLLVMTGSIPLISSYDTSEILSKQNLIHSQYHPLVFSLRYMWLRGTRDLKCPDNKKIPRRKKEKLFEKKVLKRG